MPIVAIHQAGVQGLHYCGSSIHHYKLFTCTWNYLQVQICYFVHKTATHFYRQTKQGNSKSIERLLLCAVCAQWPVDTICDQPIRVLVHISITNRMQGLVTVIGEIIMTVQCRTMIITLDEQYLFPYKEACEAMTVFCVI